MKIMTDTNIVVSAVYNRQSKTADVLNNVCENHTLVLCDYIIAESRNVVTRKFPQHLPVLDNLFDSLSYELTNATDMESSIINPKDSPILNAAITADVDIIISGDTHFLSLDIEHPKVFSPAQYYDEFVV